MLKITVGHALFLALNADKIIECRLQKPTTN